MPQTPQPQKFASIIFLKYRCTQSIDLHWVKLFDLPSQTNSKNASNFNCVPVDVISCQQSGTLLHKTKRHQIWDATGSMPIVHDFLGQVWTSILHRHCDKKSLCNAESIRSLIRFPLPCANVAFAKKPATRKQQKAPEYLFTSQLLISIKNLYLDTK